MFQKPKQFSCKLNKLSTQKFKTDLKHCFDRNEWPQTKQVLWSNCSCAYKCIQSAYKVLSPTRKAWNEKLSAKEKKVQACQKVLKPHLAANGKRPHRPLQREAAPLPHEQRKPRGLAGGTLRKRPEPSTRSLISWDCLKRLRGPQTGDRSGH